MRRRTDQLLKIAERQKDSADEGKSSITQVTREFSDEMAAETALQRFKQKLLHVNDWQKNSGVSTFQLVHKNGEEIKSSKAQIGNFIRINLPGTGKYDWVQIIDIVEDKDELVLTIEPSFDPRQNDTEKTSHFFKRGATNNFCLQRQGNTLAFGVIGLNEEVNTDETGGVLESLRNLATAELGWLGFQKIEWKIFCGNFLEKG